MSYRVVRPDGSVIPHRPEVCMEYALWSAAEIDALRARVAELESALVRASQLFPIPLPEGEGDAR